MEKHEKESHEKEKHEKTILGGEKMILSGQKTTLGGAALQRCDTGPFLPAALPAEGRNPRTA